MAGSITSAGATSSSSWWGILTGSQCAVEGASLAISDACVPSDAKKYRETSSFLEVHVPDRPMRCIIEPSSVEQAIQQQGDELMRRDNRRKQDAASQERQRKMTIEAWDKDDGRWDDEVMSGINPASTVLGTEVTTNTANTKLVSNRDRYAARNMDGSSSPAASFDLRANFRSKSESHGRDASLELMPPPRVARAISTRKQPGCVPSMMCFGDFGHLKEEYYKALHLRMDANFSNFYMATFLRLFPTSPIPRGLQRSRSGSSSSGSGSIPFACNPQFTPPRDNVSFLDLASDSSSSSPIPVSPSDHFVNFGTDLPNSPIRYMMDNASFMDLAFTGTLGMVDRGLVQSESIKVLRNGLSAASRKPPEQYLVLINRRSGVPLAVCALKSPYGPPVVRIYATKQRVFGQRPAASTSALGMHWSPDDYPLFAWAEFTAEGEFPLPVRYNLFMSCGSDGRFEKEPSYRGSHRQIGSPEIMLLGKTEGEDRLRGAALFALQSAGGGSKLAANETFLRISLSRGIDPALMVCFAAIVDETMEKTMRLHCDVYKSKVRKARRPNGNMFEVRGPAPFSDKQAQGKRRSTGKQTTSNS
mmetsp:Transcript_17405/g.25740  ORF Transcript_17405/g.25740 Transcript_17405/m.25740 type:complete len:588 (-) Transcript_17405:173-1936(-)